MTRSTIARAAFLTALAWAERGTCPKKKVGAVVTTDRGRVVATGYNGAPGGLRHCDDISCLVDEQGDCVRAVHAELNALIVAGHQARKGKLYVTDHPCPSCALAAIASGIELVFYLHDRPDDTKRRAARKLLTDAGVILLGPYEKELNL